MTAILASCGTAMRIVWPLIAPGQAEIERRMAFSMATMALRS